MTTIITQAQVDQDGLVIQAGTSLGDREGCTILALDEASAQALAAALSQPNSGVTLGPDGQWIVLEPEPLPEEVAVDSEQRQTDLATVQARADRDPDFAALLRLLGLT